MTKGVFRNNFFFNIELCVSRSHQNTVNVRCIMLGRDVYLLVGRYGFQLSQTCTIPISLEMEFRRTYGTFQLESHMPSIKGRSRPNAT